MPLLCLLWGLAALLVVPTALRGEDQQLVGETGEERYLITLSGSVGQESFSGVQAVLALSHPDILSTNPYQAIVAGYPLSNIRNVFYWNSEEGPMDVMGSEISSRTRPAGLGLSDNHFYYLSPVLLQNPGVLTQHEKERRKHAEETALPTKIFAAQGELRLLFAGGGVQGSIRMVGLDSVGNEYVHYQAVFAGSKTRERLPEN